jgi:hypothetical protein
MSAQSISKIDIQNTCEKIDDYLICEGNSFRNIIDYDLDFKVDYDKISQLLYLKEIMTKGCDNEKVLLIINKLLLR